MPFLNGPPYQNADIYRSPDHDSFHATAALLPPSEVITEKQRERELSQAIGPLDAILASSEQLPRTA